jgi:hypothetical protein
LNVFPYSNSFGNYSGQGINAPSSDQIICTNGEINGKNSEDYKNKPQGCTMTVFVWEEQHQRHTPYRMISIKPPVTTVGSILQRSYEPVLIYETG